MGKMKKVIGVAFIEDGKLLIVQSVRSSKNNIWTLIGGGVAAGESEVEAAIREVGEEIHNGFEIKEEDLIPVMCFKEAAASDPETTIIMTIFICTKKIDTYFSPDHEILKYHWYKLGEKEYQLSSAIRDHFVPFAIDEGILY
ncbi:MAG: NUDIX domain-containing protein [Mollicutes bacterium]|nr:NUDIX domain-containing protein [Mollicutes bacterium]